MIDEHLNCHCLGCQVVERKMKGEDFRYPRNAYGLVFEVAAYSFLKKRKEDPKADLLHVTCRYFIDSAIEYGRNSFGSLAAVLFDVLEVRTAADMGRIVESLKRLEVLSASGKDEDTFEQYDVDFVKEFSQPEPKGVP